MNEKRDCNCVRMKHEHGTRAAYGTDKCRCPECRAANAEHSRENRRANSKCWTGRIGTVRRLQALVAAGWSLNAISTHAHIHLNTVWSLCHRPITGDLILKETAAFYKNLYDDLWWRTPPGRYQLKSVRVAERYGWAAPWQWEGIDIDDPSSAPAHMHIEDKFFIDEIAVEEAMNGRPVTLTRAERAEAVRRLTDHGYSANQIAERLRTNKRMAQRDRRATRKREATAA